MKWHKFRSAYVEGQWISPFYVQLDRLGKIAATTSVMTDHAAEEYDGYFLPGIPNGHSHSFQYVMAGLCERVTAGHENDDFWIWREQMYRLANAIQLDDLLSVTTQLYMNMLEHGYTSVAEFNYLHHDLGGKAFGRSTEIGEVMMEAAERSGIRLTLVPVYYKQAAPNQAIKPQQKRFYFDRVDSYLKFLDETVSVALKNYSDVTVGYGLHSLRAAPLDDIKILLSHRWTQGPCHFHASEQASDVRAFCEAYGARPIKWLADNVPLGPVHNLVHATHIDAEESSLLVRSGATVVLCPTTEANLGDGVFPVLDFQKSKGSWAIGSDSQVNLNPFLEMAAPELTQRLLDRRRNVFCQDGQLESGDILYKAALSGGRKSVGMPQGSFVVGNYLEGILVDSQHDRLLERPLSNILSILCYAPEKAMIKAVISRGRLVVKDGRHLGKPSNEEGYRQAMRNLLPKLSSI